MNVALITERSQLEGTSYFEFAIGADASTHWNVGSAFVHMDVFDLIEDVVAKTIVGFNPYGPTTLSRARALELSAALKEFGGRVGQAGAPEDVFGPRWEQMDGELRGESWANLKRDLTHLIGQLRRWLDKVAASGGQVTILGI